MVDKQKEQGSDEWDDILNHLRQVRQQVQEQGPLPEHEKQQVTDAFHRGLALLENQVRDAQGGLHGSSGGW
ncbi:hypothetical protein MUN84_09130 [Hymenobacter sp. 5516J-16]|uniref:Uncharacterized protein n=1 Tax=Hymenobacter sublimis TaxID=2933777 RepID=A0ABY4J753_9BACT|nr:MULTISPECIES: hypothetical protein [Hymenobacter]UOQ78673.1 hypothetical protein MUN84_09130 [Hymenobacter sp. 5516J-16]UPL48655.1 hypothetical protein MWH26_15870 [Hymenobacter sublimis]